VRGGSGHPTLRRKLRRDIRRTRALFGALVTIVMLGIFLYVVADNAYRNLQASYDNAFAVQGFPDLFVTGGDVAGLAAQASGTAGVEATRLRVQADLPVEVPDPEGSDRLVGRIVGYPTSGTPEVARLSTLSGAANPGPSQVLVEEHMADAFDLAAGDRLVLTTAVGEVEVTVAGVVSSAEYLWPAPNRQVVIAPPRSFGVLFVAESDARAWSGAPENQALVLLDDAGRADPSLIDDLRGAAVAAGAGQVLDRSEQPSNALLQEDISGFEQMAVAFPALFLSAAALTLYVLLTRRVREERPVIGMLRAHGMSARVLAGHYLSYGLLAGAVGAVIALPLGVAAAHEVSLMYASAIGLPEQLTVFTGFHPGTLLIGLGFALVATGVASALPARRAAAVQPAEAMRGEVPRGVVRRGRLERALPGLGRAPARVRMVVREVARTPRRTLFTSSGVALSLILVLVSWGLIDTMNHLIGVQFEEVSTADAQVGYSVPVTPDRLAALEAVDGVARAEAALILPVSVAHAGGVYSTTITGYDQGTVMHGFIDTRGRPVDLPDDGVLIDGAITDQLPDLAPGDTVELTVAAPDGPVVVSTTVRDFTYQPLGTFVHADRSWLDGQVPGAPATTALITTDPTADPEAVRRSVQQLPDVVSFAQTSALRDQYRSLSGLFYVFIAAMLVLGSAIAFAIIFTTMSVNIMERQRELATLRAAGVRQRTIASLVGAENTLIAAIGVVPGLVLGLVGARFMLQTYASDQFTLTLYVQPLTLVLSAAVIMVVAVLSQWPGLRAVRRMDVAQVVRERAA